MTAPNPNATGTNPNQTQSRFDVSAERAQHPNLAWLSQEGITKLRDEQYALIAEKQKNIDPFDLQAMIDAKNEAINEFAGVTEEYLAAFGVEYDKNDPNSKPPKYDEYIAALDHFSVNNMSDSEWMSPQINGPNGLAVSGKDQAYYDHRDQAKDMLDEAEQEHADFTRRKHQEQLDSLSEDTDKLQKEVNALFERRNKAYAERMAASGFNRSKKRKKLHEDFERADKEYLSKLRELQEKKVEKQRFEGEDEDVIKAQIIEDVKQLLEDGTEAQHLALVDQGGMWAKILEHYSNSSRAKKIILGLGAAGVIAITGGVAGLAFGAAGGAAAGAALGAVKVGKAHGIAYSELYKRKDRAEIKFNADPSLGTEDIIDKALNRISLEAKEDINDGDKKKRRAVYIAMGTAAMAGFGGSVLSQAVGLVNDGPGGTFGGWTGNGLFDSNVVPNHPSVVPPEVHPPQMGGGIINPETGDGLNGSNEIIKDVESNPTGPKSAEDIINGNSSGPKVAEAGGVEAHPETSGKTVESLQIDSRLEKGDGFYRIFERNGFNREKWADILGGAGERLSDIDMSNGQPLSYQTSSGEWRIRMTPDGKIPNEAMAILYEEAAKVDALPKVEVMDIITPADVNDSGLNRLAYAPGVETSVEKLLTDNGLGNAWLEINKPEIRSQLMNLSPNTFRESNGVFVLNPNAVVSPNALAFLANYMSASERIKLGLPV